MYAVLPEKHLGVKAGLQIITPCPAHILYDDVRYFPGLNIRNQILPCRAVKIAARIPVVGVVDKIFIALLAGVGFEVFFLIDD